MRRAMRRIERDRAAIAGQRRGRMFARMRALPGEKRDGGALARRRVLGRRDQRLDTALGAFDVAVGEQPLRLQPTDVGAIGRERDGAIERFGRERAIAGGARRARHQEPALDRSVAARRRQHRRQLEHVGVMAERLPEDAGAPASIDVPGNALDERAQLRERAFEIAARLAQRRRLRDQRHVRVRRRDHVVDEQRRALDLAALAQVRHQRHAHRHRRRIGVERALEQLARAIVQIGARRAQLGRAQQAMRARPSVVARRQRRPALEAIDGAIAGVDRFVERHQRLQRVDRVGLALEHRLPALDRLPRIVEVALVHRGQLAPQRRALRRIGDGADVARALVGERGEAPFGAIVIDERAPHRLVGLVLEQPLERLDGAPALAELAPGRRQRALQRGALAHANPMRPMSASSTSIAIADAPEARIEAIERAQRRRIARQAVAQYAPALHARGGGIERLLRHDLGRFAQRREIVGIGRRALVEQREQRMVVAALAQASRVARGRAGAPDGARASLGRGGHRLGEQRFELGAAVRLRHDALEAGALAARSVAADRRSRARERRGRTRRSLRRATRLRPTGLLGPLHRLRLRPAPGSLRSE